MSLFERLVIKYLRLIASMATAILVGPLDIDTKRALIKQMEDLSTKSDKFLARR